MRYCMSKERIFPTEVQLDALNAMSENTLVSHLGILFTAIGDDYIEATMPVDERTIQPLGLLHGGASVSLAETLGSIAAVLTLDMTKQYPVGLEINTNHLRSIRSGIVTGRATPEHIGRSTQVWTIEIRNNENKKVAISRITMAILDVK